MMSKIENNDKFALSPLLTFFSISSLMTLWSLYPSLNSLSVISALISNYLLEIDVLNSYPSPIY